MIEHFRLGTGGKVDYDFVVDDPKMYTKPWANSRPLTPLKPARGLPDLIEYNCSENNRDVNHLMSRSRRSNRLRRQSLEHFRKKCKARVWGRMGSCRGLVIRSAVRSEPTRRVKSRLPEWVLADRFDIQARASGNPTKGQMRVMMRSLLADRFKLAIHFEAREVPVFALVLAKPETQVHNSVRVRNNHHALARLHAAVFIPAKPAWPI